MKMILALPLLAVGLAACDPVPRVPYPPPADPAGESQYRAIGTEPFWDLNIGRDLVFTDRGSDFAVAEPAPPPVRGVAGETYSGRRLIVTILRSRCSDGMSERVYPDTVNLVVDGRPYRGCGAPTAFFSQIGENGLPRAGGTQGAFNLANTNWRVVSINGQRVPTSGYYLNFMPDRLSGKLGCNSIGAGYDVSRNLLSAGAIMMTRMACPNGNFEAQGTAIMVQPMTISESGDSLTLSNRVGTIELTRAR